MGCFERSEISGNLKPQTPGRDIALATPLREVIWRDPHLMAIHTLYGIPLKVCIRGYGVMGCTPYGTSPSSADPFIHHI